MEIRHLEYFLVVVQEGNFSKAANVLHISQPTLSRQIMQLEEEIGKPLLVRGKTKVKMTEEGVLLRNRAEEILSLTNKTLKDLRSDEKNITGEINVASGETDSFSYIASKIHEFNVLYPNVCFNVSSANVYEMKEKIDKGLLDLAIFTAPVDVSNYNYLNINHSECWGILVNDNHVFSSKTSISLKELESEKMIFPHRLLSEKISMDWFFDCELNIVATYNLINSALMLMEKEVGIVFCIEKEMYKKLNLTFIPLDPIREATSILVWKKERIINTTLRKFIDILSYSVNE
jgi:DNA-binding transcriptional LysR family regulator